MPSFSGGESLSVGAAGTFLMERLFSSSPNAAVWRIGNRGCGGVDEDVVISAHQVVGNMASVDMVDDIITVNSIILQRLCTAKGSKVHILHYSLFSKLLLAPNDVEVAELAEEVHQQAPGATTFAGVCNIRNAHRVAFSVDLTTNTVTQYDSGAHFLSLAVAVNAALVRVRKLSKRLWELRETASDDAVSADQIDEVGDLGSSTKAKVWSIRRVSAPAQDGTCSCGPFSFAYVWHAAQGKKSKLKTADAAALRVEMLANVVGDRDSHEGT